MKMTIKPMYLLFFLLLSTVSCNNEELFIEPTSDVVIDDTTIPEDDTVSVPPVTTPCDFNLNNVAANATVIINCVMDLGGATITLPANVTIVYEGGDIINGTINFGNANVVSGELLNATLTITGSKPQLKDTTFHFDPKRWGIVEGKVSDAVALKNKEILQGILNQTKALGVNVFSIDKMNAYFNVIAESHATSTLARNAILMPSNFELIMTDNTFLRVQPNSSAAYGLLAFYKVVNSAVSGGNLIGDRWEHDYSPDSEFPSHEFGHPLIVGGSHNITIDNVNISNATGDGFFLVGSRIRNPDGTVRDGEMECKNVIVKNSIIKNSRRNGMSLLDGNGILVENCEIIDTGLGTNPDGVKYSSAGTWPKYGICFEAISYRTSDGTLITNSKIDHVVLRGNDLVNNAGGDVVLTLCSNITIENNHFDSMIANIQANDIIIKDNNFKAKIKNDGTPWGYAMLFKSNKTDWDGELNYNYTISGNTVEGYQNGMVLGGNDYKVFGNTIKDCVSGVVFGDLSSSELHNNNIFSDLEYSVGYRTNSAIMDNVIIRDEIVEVDYRPINLRNFSTENANKPIKFTTSRLISKTGQDNFIDSSKNISITNNVINTDFIVQNSENITVTNNTSN